MTRDAHPGPARAFGSLERAALMRGAGLFALWCVLMQSAKPADVAVGVLATIGATYASLRLLPPEAGRVKLVWLLALLPRFLWLSLLAGIDVARRVFVPSLPLSTGYVEYRTGFPRGQARNNFLSIASLMPGSLPSGESSESIEIHCLDTAQPIVEQMAEEERLLAKALFPGRRHA